MLKIAEDAARAGGEILIQYFRTNLTIEHKGDVDLVTEADLKAEETIVTYLRNKFPRHNILAEENDYDKTDSSYCWVIDPLDGTTNFAHGFPWFAVSIALVKDNNIVLGIIFDPIHDLLFTAEQGMGATLNGSPIHVSKQAPLSNSLLATGFPYDRKTSEVNNFDHFYAFQQAARACRRPGAASLDLAYTALGSLDGYWEMKLKPWDIAAGMLLVTEAGGIISNFDSDPITIFSNEILASNGLIHDEMVEILQNGKRPHTPS